MSLKERYKKEIVPALQEELGLGNQFEVPRFEKIVINVGLGDAAQNAKLLDMGVEELQTISGQKPIITRAKKSIAGFKIREGMPIGAKVTLRGERMYDFLSKLTGVVLPRIRDFRGLNPQGFDGLGNYNLGLKDQLVFVEVNYDKVQRTRGFNITFVTSAKTDMAAKALLEKFDFRFRKSAKSSDALPQAQAS